MLLSGYYDVSSEGHTLGAHGPGSYIADGGWIRQMGEMKPPNVLHGKGIRFLAYTEGFQSNNMWAGPVTILGRCLSRFNYLLIAPIIYVGSHVSSTLIPN
jgi:hypothetical protein